MLTLFVPLSLAAFGIVLRGSSFAFRKEVTAHVEPAQLRRRVRDLVGARAVLLGRGRRARSPRAGCRPGGEAGDPWDELAEPHVDPRRRARGRGVRVPRRRCTWSGTRAGFGDDDMVEYFRRRAVGAAIATGVDRGGRHLRAARRRRATSSTASPSRALPARDRLGALRARLARAAARATRTVVPGCSRSARCADRDRLGRRPVALHAPRRR